MLYLQCVLSQILTCTKFNFYTEWIDTRSEICIDRSGLFGEKERKIQDKIAEVRRVYKWNENGMVERLVSNVSSLVTLQLWTLAVQDAKLKEQLHLVNDFFLLGRGELFHEFVSQADQYLSKSATGNFGVLSCCRKHIIISIML